MTESVMQKATNIHLKRFGVGLLVVGCLGLTVGVIVGIVALFHYYTAYCYGVLGVLSFAAFVYWLGWVITKPAPTYSGHPEDY